MLPLTAHAGDTWTWLDSSADYSSADGWELTTSLRGTGGGIDITATTDGAGGWTSTAAATSTAPLTAGRYAWAARVSKTTGTGDDAVTESHTIATGTIEVLAGLAELAEGTDTRTTTEIQLAAVESAVTALLSKQHASVSVADQSYSLVDIEKLFRIRDKLRAQVESERIRSNGGSGRRVLVHFR